VNGLIEAGTFSAGGASFYRSDFVIQFGVHGTGKERPKLKANESKQSGMSNTRGTAAFAHWDVPDCGDTEIFINLSSNTHLDSAYGGFCVFASTEKDDAASDATIDAIAKAIASGKQKTVKVNRVSRLSTTG
jgi:cyclophilin family peptidyl-prolyl cis-trans isomerase